MEVGLSVSDEHVLHEESVVRPGADDPDLPLVLFIEASKSINDKDSVGIVHAVNCFDFVPLIPFWFNGNVDVTPPDGLIKSYQQT